MFSQLQPELAAVPKPAGGKASLLWPGGSVFHKLFKSLMEVLSLFEILLQKLKKRTRTSALWHRFSILILVRS